MKSDRKASFARKRAARALKDILRNPQAAADERVFETVKKLLAAGECEEINSLTGLVAGRKLFGVCRKSEAISEVILIDRLDPKKIYRGRLILKGENDAGKA